MVRRSASAARDERAERRASFHDAVAEAAHVSAGPGLAQGGGKQVPQAVLHSTSGSPMSETANVRTTAGHTPRASGGNGDVAPVFNIPGSGGQQAPVVPAQGIADNPGDNGSGGGNDDGGQGNDGGGDCGLGQAAPVPMGDGGAGVGVPEGLAAAVPSVPPTPPAQAPPPVFAVPPAPTWVYQAPPSREKKLRLPKFRGLGEPKVTVKAWLKAVKNELRRQTAILRTEWREHEVFIEMVASLEGEALMWYDTVEDAFSRREDQTFGNLSKMMRDRYMVKRSNPEVVARLRQRRQQRGESLVEYAQKLREIASSNPVDEEWLVDSFLSGMSNAWCATLVRGHRPAALNEAVNSAVDQVGEFGEGYGVDLATAIRAHDERATTSSSTPVMATPDLCRPQQFSVGGNLGSVVSGYDDVGLATGPPPRYDVEGRLVLPAGGATLQAGSQWNMVIPAGYRLVPEATATAATGAAANTAATKQTSTRQQTPQHQRSDGGNKQHARTGKTLKMESQGTEQQPARQQQQQRWSGGRQFRNDEPLRTREDRVRNHRRYMERRTQQQQSNRTGMSRSDDMCFYCHGFGHHAHACELKKQDMEESSPVVTQSREGGNQDANSNSGNDGRM